MCEQLEDLFGTSDLFQILGLNSPASLKDPSEIRLGYLRQLIRNHPDTCPTQENEEYTLRCRRVVVLVELYNFIKSGSEDVKQYVDTRKIPPLKSLDKNSKSGPKITDIPTFELVGSEMAQLIRAKLRKLEELNKLSVADESERE